jgi:chromosome segregation ATPase
MSKPPQLNLHQLHHALLAIEVSRLQDVISHYEDNLQNLGREVEGLNFENDELHEDNMKLRNEVADLRRRLEAPKPLQMPPQPTVIKTVYVQEPHPVPQVVQPQVIIPPQPKPQPPTFNPADLFQDDKSGLINLLVKKNIENDHLRRELDFYRHKAEGASGEITRSYNVSQDGSRTGELIRAIGDLFAKNRHSDIDVDHGSLSVRNSAYKVASNLDPKPRSPHLDASFGPEGLASDLRDIQLGVSTTENYLIERQKLLNSIDAFLSRLSFGQKPGTEVVRRPEAASPIKDSQPTEEFRTEIINGVPTRVKIFRQTIDQVTNITTFGGDRSSQSQSLELASALRKISELERQNQMLQSQIDLLGRHPISKEASDVTTSLIQRDLQDWRMRAAGLESELHMASKELDQEAGRVKRLETDREDLLHRVKVFEGLYDEAKEGYEKLKSQLRALEDQEKSQGKTVIETRTLYESRSRELEQAREEIADKKGRIAELEAKNRVFSDENVELRQMVKAVSIDLENRKDFIAQIKIEAADKDREIASLKTSLKKLNEELAEMDNTLIIMKNKLQDKQSQIESLASKDKDMHSELTNQRSLVKRLEDEMKSNQSAVSKQEGDARKSSKAKEAYRLSLQKLTASLNVILEKVRAMSLDVKESRLIVAREMIDYKKSFQVLKKLLQSKGEFNPKGTLQALIEMKERHNEDIPKLASKLTTYESLLQRKDSEIMSNMTEKEKEIEALEKQIQAVKLEKETFEKLKAAEQHSKDEELVSLRAKVRRADEESEKTLNENARLQKEGVRKEREIRELKADFEAEASRVEDLKKTIRKLHGQLEQGVGGMSQTSPSKKQEVFIRTIGDGRATVGQNPGVRVLVDQHTGQLPAEVDIFIDATARKGDRVTTETRTTIPKNYTTEASQQFQHDTEILERQLKEAYSQIKHYEQQLHALSNKDVQRDSIVSRLSEVEDSLLQLQVILKNKDSEIERLKSQLMNSRPSSPMHNQDEHDRVEVLRQRTEAMLGKLEKKLESLQRKSTGHPGVQLDALTLEVQGLRKRLQESSRRFVNEYIAVCQRSLDVYEKL